jgi:hypothetical protein
MCTGPEAALITTAVIGTERSISAQREAKQESQRAASVQQTQFKEEQKKADIQNVRSVREQIRATRLAQSSMVNQAALTGGMGGSALAGGVSSAGSQLSGNLSYMEQISQQNTVIGGLAAEAAGYQANAAAASADSAIWGAVGQAALTGYKIKKAG